MRVTKILRHHSDSKEVSNDKELYFEWPWGIWIHEDVIKNLLI